MNLFTLDCKNAKKKGGECSWIDGVGEIFGFSRAMHPVHLMGRWQVPDKVLPDFISDG